jgi:hypothetical protein
VSGSKVTLLDLDGFFGSQEQRAANAKRQKRFDGNQ